MTDLLNWLAGTTGYTVIAAALVLALITHFVGSRAWSAMAWAGCLALLAAAFVGQREITAQLRIDHANTLRVIADKTAVAYQAALEAEQAITIREHELATTIANNHAHAEQQQQRLRADRDRADAAAHSLRQQLAAIRTASPGHAADADPAAAGQQQAADTTTRVLAELLERADERAGILASFADQAHAAGSACQRDYDAVTAAQNPAQ